MASAPYLDDFESSLNKLPEELQQNLTLMLDLNSKSRKLMDEADKMADDYISNIRKYSVEKQKGIMSKIQSKFDEAKNISDDKVQLSIQNYALVDKHIRKLDTELLRFKGKTQLQTDMRDTAIKAKINLPPKKGGSKLKGPSTSSAVTGPSNQTNSVDNVAVATSCLSGASVGHRIAHSAYVDMPIDPNEPTFCLCKQVLFGEMIGCDNPDCDIEWFHFECVSLTTKPKEEWFCPNCVKDKKKK
ncbi:inhibitor of growth protein 4-like [Metopolophium dirhodum]|uniref:inhibitor of growth protein 4-like n=1 Tax=Metopolophium dirhodum TaxID=44670 RepID=UPI0029907AB3|nr:inhibitor of growth protein 4-like [Metopolophium dirhodum]